MKRQTIIWLAGILLLGGFLLLVVLPVPAKLTSKLPVQEQRVLDRNGTLLATVAEKGSGPVIWTSLKDLPEDFVQALLTTEDRTFTTHAGISVRGIARALLHNIQGGGIREGGSTLTQQYVRLRLGRSNSLLGKLREAYWALKLERVLTKNEILERYINTAPFGGGSVGIEAGARTFFGKAPQELSLSESAFLVGLLQSPTALDPRKNFAGAKTRQELILTGMEAHGDISAEETDEAKKLSLHMNPEKLRMEAPHFVYWVLNEFDDQLPEEGDIHTTLDLSLQRDAEAIVQREVQKLSDHRVTNAAVVVLDATTGEILSMVGSNDYFDASIDGAVNVAVSARQPGSTLKPFTYALALTKGDTAATVIADTDANFLTQEGFSYTPRNYDFDTHGPVSYREALGNSYNIAVVRVLEKIGVSTLLNFLRSIDITTLNNSAEHYGLALTLGSGEVKLLELVSAYGIFPRGGKTLTPRALLQKKAIVEHQVLDPKIAWIISDILSDNTARLQQFGEHSALTFDFPVAAKTGTTRNSRDNWTIGFTPSRIVGVWVGNADNTPMRNTSGVTGAGPIFHAVMEEVMKNEPKIGFARPPGMLEREVCKLSGKLPTKLCPAVRKEVFVAGTEPRIPDDTFQLLTIDLTNGLLVPEGCKIDETKKQTYAFFSIELRPWAREHGWPDPPTRISPRCSSASSLATESFSAVQITNPNDGDRFRLSPLLPLDAQRISFRATTDSSESVTWNIDGTDLGTGSGADHLLRWIPVTGNHVLRATGGGNVDEVVFDVIPFSDK